MTRNKRIAALVSRAMRAEDQGNHAAAAAHLLEALREGGPMDTVCELTARRVEARAVKHRLAIEAGRQPAPSTWTTLRPHHGPADYQPRAMTSWG